MEKDFAIHNTGLPSDSDSANAFVDEFVHGLHVPEVTWYKHAGLRKLYLLMIFLMLGSTTIGYDGVLIGGLQAIDAWQVYFQHPTGSRLGLIATLYALGGFCALPFNAYLSDILGRKKGSALAVTVMLIGAGVQLIPNPSDPQGPFIAGRFLVGFGSFFIQGNTPLLILELAYPQHRGKLTSIYNCLFGVGAIIAAWTCFGTVLLGGDQSWRIPVGLQLVMPAIMFCGLWFLPESPRWLLSKDRGEEAFAILVKYHANGDASEHFVRAEFAEIQSTLKLEKENAGMGWLQFVKTTGNRRRILLLSLVAFFSQCNGSGLISYYLAPILVSVGITSSYNQTLINGGLQLFNFITGMSCAFLVDKFGRKRLFLASACCILIVFICITICSALYAETGNIAAGSGVIALIFIFQIASSLAYPCLCVTYPMEIVPFNIRAKGLSYFWAFVAVSAIVSQYVNPVGLESITWKFYFVYIGIQVFMIGAISFWFIETRGPTLEEIARLFDGDDANVAGKEIIQAKPHMGESEHV